MPLIFIPGDFLCQANMPRSRLGNGITVNCHEGDSDTQADMPLVCADPFCVAERTAEDEKKKGTGNLARAVMLAVLLHVQIFLLVRLLQLENDLIPFSFMSVQCVRVAEYGKACCLQLLTEETKRGMCKCVTITDQSASQCEAKSGAKTGEKPFLRSD